MPTQMSIHDAKTNLSKLIEEAVSGGEVIIAKAGKPVVKLVPVDPPASRSLELGWAAGRWSVPDDLKDPFRDDINEIFRLND